MRGTREPSHQNWHSADLSQLCWHAYMHMCACVRGRMCGCVYDAWVAGGGGRNVREVQRDQSWWRRRWREYSSETRWIKTMMMRELKIRLRSERGILQWVASNESRAAGRYDKPEQSRRDWTPASEDETDVSRSRKHETLLAVKCCFTWVINQPLWHGVVLWTQSPYACNSLTASEMHIKFQLLLKCSPSMSSLTDRQVC